MVPKTPGFWKTLEQFVQWYFSAGAITKCSWSSVSSFGISTLMLGIGLKAKKNIVHGCNGPICRFGLIGKQTTDDMNTRTNSIWNFNPKSPEKKTVIAVKIGSPLRKKTGPLKNLVHSLWKIPPMLFIFIYSDWKSNNSFYTPLMHFFFNLGRNAAVRTFGCKIFNNKR